MLSAVAPLAFGGTVAFAEIDLAVGAGEIHAVIGPNGAGKSSLINAITGLYAPQAGRVRIGALPSVAARLLPDAVQAFAVLSPGTAVMVEEGPHEFLVNRLKAGELVIVEGIQKVRPGQVVNATVVPRS